MWRGDAFTPRTFAHCKLRAITGRDVSAKESSTVATPAFLPKIETENPRTLGPNSLTGGVGGLAQNPKFMLNGPPHVNCANESMSIPLP